MSDERLHSGVPVSPGIAIGKVYLYRHDEPEIKSYCVLERHRPKELKRLEEGIRRSQRQLAALHKELSEQVGEAVALIFEAQALILEDEEFVGEIRSIVKYDGLNAEHAVKSISEKWIEQFTGLGQELYQQRAQDVRDVSVRLIKTLLGTTETAFGPEDEDAILVADDLMPSDIIRLSAQRIIGVATDLGGATSHTAILTRSLEVPAVVGLGDLSATVETGDVMILSGNSGAVIVHPEEETCLKYREKRASYAAFVHGLKDIVGLPAETLDGTKIILRANIELPREANAATYYGGEGIGLFRSEYLFLARQKLPSEEEQLTDYLSVMEAVKPHPVTIRTFDLGGDKVFTDLPRPAEANPFMGWRAVRVSLDEPELFRTQLRAILRAAAVGPIRLMVPFIVCAQEVQRVKQVINSVKQELASEGVEHNPDIPVGVMIEIPSSAILADTIAPEVDFFSIGTNDLTQFALAVDRSNGRVAHLYRPLHPAILRLILMSIEAGKSNGIPVGMCGELAANPLAVMILIGMGITELSVSPVMVPQVKKLIRSMEFKTAVAIAEQALTINTPNELEMFILREMKQRFGDLPIWNNGGN